MQTFDLRVIVDIIGLVQGIVLGTILIVVNKKNKKSSFYLGLFVLAFSLDFLPPLLDYLGLTAKYPRLHYLPLRLSDFLFPLLYIYVEDVSILRKKRKSYWVLIPAGVANLLVFIIFLLPDNVRDIANQNFTWFFGLKIATEVFGLVLGFIIIHKVNGHIRSLNEQYTNTTYKTLRWVKIYAIIGILFTMIVPILNEFFSNYYYILTVSTLNGILLYWVSIRGIMQNNVLPLLPENENIISNIDAKKNLEPEKNREEYEVFSNEIDALLKKEKLYRRTDLTIIDLADALHIHPKYLSVVINSYFKQNFNSFINRYRVEDAIQLLQSTKAQNLSIDGIGYEVGFKSKSSFYTSFKQITGTTPSQFKESALS